MRAEYVAAGPDLALVRVAAPNAEELLVFSGGRVQSFEPLPGAPGDERTGFPVPLDLLRADDAEFRLGSSGDEVALAPPPEAAPVPRRPAVDPALEEAHAELERERALREELEREAEQRA